MINVNELKLGNYVEHNNLIHKVELITDSYVHAVYSDSQRYSRRTIFAEQLKPIEITPEVLGRLGFDAMSVVLRTYNGDKIFDWCDKSKLLCMGSIGMPCNYVHELQNLVCALTKQTLTLDSTGGEL